MKLKSSERPWDTSQPARGSARAASHDTAQHADRRYADLDGRQKAGRVFTQLDRGYGRLVALIDEFL